MNKMAKLAIGGASALALAIAVAGPALADPNPVGTSANSGGDIVAVGSDTLQFGDDFVADGTSTNPGYNSFHPAQRYVSFDAVDPYTQNSTVTIDGQTLPSTEDIRLRGDGNGKYGVGTAASEGTATGTTLIPRINGSTEGKQALLPTSGCGSRSTSDGYPAAPLAQVDIARASSGLSTTQDTTSCLQQAPFATDTIQIAVSNLVATNAPTTLTVQQLQQIYEPDSCNSGGTLSCPFTPIRTWNQINPSYSSDTIIPSLPQSGSGTRSTFLTDIFTNAGLADPGTYNPNLITTEEHNPQPFITPPAGVSAADIIAPFSGGRATLIANGYFGFLNPGNTTAQGNYANSIKLLATGTGGTSLSSAYNHTRNLYHDARASDVSNNPAWLSGLLGPSGFFCSSSATPLLQLAGLTQLTTGCGNFS